MKRLGVACCLLLTLMLAAVPLHAQQAPAPAADSSTASTEVPKVVTDKLDQLDQKVAAAQSSADNAWMLVSAALVLMMTGPGLALFYGGLVRQKNVLAIMMQSFALMALITVLWALVGYSLAFGGSGPFIGNFQHAFLRGIGADPNPDYAATIPQLTFMIYQLMFAIITPALITGATAERMKFSGTVLFMTLWFFCRLRADGAHGVGQRWVPERGAGWPIPDSGFCGWHRGAHHVGSFRAGLRIVSREARRLPKATYAATQPGAQFHRRLPALGGVVRIQRGKRAGFEWSGDYRVRGHTFRSRCGGDKLEPGGMDQEWTGQCARRNFRRRGRTRGHHASCGICRADASAG